MIQLHVTITGIPNTDAALKALPAVLIDEMDAATRASMFQVTRTAQTKYLSGPRPQRLGVMTNRLRGSLTEGQPNFVLNIQRQALTITGQIGTNVVYAAIHEYGGVIRPTHGSFLFIPGRAITTPTGAVQKAYQGSLRNVPDTFVRPNPRGGWYVFQRRGRGPAKLIGVLKSSVTIPARPYMAPAVKDNLTWIHDRYEMAAQNVSIRLQRIA